MELFGCPENGSIATERDQIVNFLTGLLASVHEKCGRVLFLVSNDRVASNQLHVHLDKRIDLVTDPLLSVYIRVVSVVSDPPISPEKIKLVLFEQLVN